MVKHKIISSIFLAIFLMILIKAGVIETKIFAAELTLQKSLINPDSYLLYSMKRLFEKAIVITKLSKDSRVDYFKELTQKRLSELKYVVENKLLVEVQQSSQRLSYQVGILSDYIHADQDQLSKQKLEVNNLLNSYQELLISLRDKYPYNSSYWMLIQHSINSIDLNLEKLK